MKPFEKLTYRGRIRRLRQLARVALQAYGLSTARLTFLRQAGNTLFRVHEACPTPGAKADLYAPGQYLLRMHEPGYQTTAGIELELAWLASMCRDADLPVSEPLPALDGRLLAQVSIPGIPGEYNCSLLRWIRGREIKPGAAQPRHYRAQGQLMARLHQHAAHWQPPAGLVKRKYDWEGLFRDDCGVGIPAGEAWSLLPQEYVQPYELVARKMQQVMDAWGKAPDVYGLIHADLGVEANLLFWRGEARAIDFDDSGFGYYIYDLSISLEHCQEDPAQPRFREALLDGYTRVRPLPEDQLEYLDLCMAAFWVFWSLWAAAGTQRYPNHRQELLERMGLYFKRVERYLASLPVQRTL